MCYSLLFSGLSAFVFLLLTALTSRVSFHHIVLQWTLHNNIWYSFLIFFQDKFKKKAEDRAREDAALDEPKPYVKPVQRDNLRQRDFKVDVAAGVGKTRLISSVKDKRSPLFLKKLNDPSKLPLLNVFYLWQPCGGGLHQCKHVYAHSHTSTCAHMHTSFHRCGIIPFGTFLYYCTLGGPVGRADQVRDKNGGYHCTVCDCILRDSMTWLDHLNGKKHQRNLGMSMRVENVGVETVKAKLAAKKRARALAKQG